jgi:hypothetical protein
MVKIVVAATPRSGSHAFCSNLEVKNNLYECMNIEDMLLPRLYKNEKIDFDICSQEFLIALDQQDWTTAWNQRPALTKHHFVLRFNDAMNKYFSNTQPTLEEFLYEHERRWKCIQQLDDWAIKIIMYQGVSISILSQMVSMADRVVVLQRKNSVDQAISLTKSTMLQLWHNEPGQVVKADAGEIDYNIFRDSLKDILVNNNWVSNNFNTPKTEYYYYEDVDFTGSVYNKNQINVEYNRERCEEILHEIQ